MRIAFYGGCFNPPHLGHLAAVREAYEALKPDRFLILPDRQPAAKPLAALTGRRSRT